MDDLLKKHRQEQRDLQARVTQKKKSATKKTRKGVNDECARLEEELKDKQNLELAGLNGKNEDFEERTLDTELVSSGTEFVTAPTDSLPTSVDANAQNASGIGAAEEKPARKPNRQKARLARRAAEQEAAVKQAEEEAANLPNERELEAQRMQTVYTARGLIEQPIRSDGHCLYAAIADQLTFAGMEPKPVVGLQVDAVEKADFKFTRRVAAAYIEQHADDFVPFLEEPLAAYVAKVRDTGEWGGHLEIIALSKAFGRDICVLHGSGQCDKIENGGHSSEQPLWLAYYKHSHGLGEHYNSLRAKR